MRGDRRLPGGGILRGVRPLLDVEHSASNSRLRLDIGALDQLREPLPFFWNRIGSVTVELAIARKQIRSVIPQPLREQTLHLVPQMERDSGDVGRFVRIRSMRQKSRALYRASM